MGGINTVNAMALSIGLSQESVGVFLQRRLPGGAVLAHRELMGNNLPFHTPLRETLGLKICKAD